MFPLTLKSNTINIQAKHQRFLTIHNLLCSVEADGEIAVHNKYEPVTSIAEGRRKRLSFRQLQLLLAENSTPVGHRLSQAAKRRNEVIFLQSITVGSVPVLTLSTGTFIMKLRIRQNGTPDSKPI
jgi:hypothetical protein